jgi:hypothetical protein
MPIFVTFLDIAAMICAAQGFTLAETQSVLRFLGPMHIGDREIDRYIALREAINMMQEEKNA